MTKLEELKAAANAAQDVAYDAAEAARAAVAARAATWAEADVAWDAYFAELDKQKENSND
jgi:hypothetical protein